MTSDYPLHRSVAFASAVRAHPLIVFAGNLATGKTTLASRVAQAFQAELFKESVDDNPYLAKFYADMPRWALHLNLYFLASRSRQLLDAEACGQPAVLDRSFYEDRVFVETAHDLGQTTEDAYQLFDAMETELARVLPAPDVLVYLSADVSTIATRINARGRQRPSRLRRGSPAAV